MTVERGATAQHGGTRWFAVRVVSVVLALYVPHLAPLFVGEDAHFIWTHRVGYLELLPVAPGVPAFGLVASHFVRSLGDGALFGDGLFILGLVALLVRLARPGRVALTYVLGATVALGSASAWFYAGMFVNAF